MNEVLTADHHLVAELSDDEYVKLRVQVAQTGGKVTLKQWVGQAIREKLDGRNNQEVKQ